MKPSLLRAVSVDQRGTALIEMAIVAPVLALGVIGIVDISNAYSRKLALEQGAQRAIEKIMQTTATDTVENTLKTEACVQVDGISYATQCAAGSGATPINTSDVTVTWRRECVTSGVVSSSTTYTSSTAFDAGSCASGTEADYLQVAITSSYTPLFSTHFSGFSGTGYSMTVTAGVRTK